MKLTENEKVFLKDFIKELERSKHVENIDGKDFCQNDCSLGSRVARGVLSSLNKKGVFDYGGMLPENKHCWNPLYMGENY